MNCFGQLFCFLSQSINRNESLHARHSQCLASDDLDLVSCKKARVAHLRLILGLLRTPMVLVGPSLTNARAGVLLLAATASIAHQEERARRAIRCLTILSALCIALFSALCAWQGVIAMNANYFALAAQLATHGASSCAPVHAPGRVPVRVQVRAPILAPIFTPSSNSSSSATTCAALVARVQREMHAACSTTARSARDDGDGVQHAAAAAPCSTGPGGTVSELVGRTGDWVDYLLFKRRSAAPLSADAPRTAFAFGNEHAGDTARRFVLAGDEHVATVAGRLHRHRAFLAESIRIITSAGRVWALKGSKHGASATNDAPSRDEQRRSSFHFAAPQGHEIVGLRVANVESQSSRIVGIETEPLAHSPQQEPAP